MKNRLCLLSDDNWSKFVTSGGPMCQTVIMTFTMLFVLVLDAISKAPEVLPKVSGVDYLPPISGGNIFCIFSTYVA